MKLTTEMRRLFRDAYHYLDDRRHWIKGDERRWNERMKLEQVCAIGTLERSAEKLASRDLYDKARVILAHHLVDMRIQGGIDKEGEIPLALFAVCPDHARYVHGCKACRRANAEHIKTRPSFYIVNVNDDFGGRKTIRAAMRRILGIKIKRKKAVKVKPAAKIDLGAIRAKILRRARGGDDDVRQQDRL